MILRKTTPAKQAGRFWGLGGFLFRRLSFWVSGLFMLGLFLPVAEGAVGEDNLFELPLEDLVQMEITSVSRKPQKLSDAAAAVFVITQEDIRRSGATSIAEALRMVPGLEVARIVGPENSRGKE